MHSGAKHSSMILASPTTLKPRVRSPRQAPRTIPRASVCDEIFNKAPSHCPTPAEPKIWGSRSQGTDKGGKARKLNLF